MEQNARSVFARPALRPLFLAAATLAAAVAPEPASACSIIPYPAEFPVNPSFAAPSPPPALRLASLTLKRARYAPPGNGDCGDVGHLALRFVQADGTAWPADYGIRLTVTSAPPPGPFTIPNYPMATTDGALLFAGGDDPSQPIDFTLTAVGVNAAGAESAPIEIHVSHGGRGGCALVGGPARASGVLAVAMLVGVLLMARRRRR